MTNHPLSKRGLLKGGLAIAGLAVAGKSNLLIRHAGASTAKHTLVFNSPYVTDFVYAPTAQGAYKRHIERLTDGEIDVVMQDKGKGGVSGELLGQVVRNRAQGGIISISNLSRYAGAIDSLNIPFWSAPNQKYVNLVTSKTWQEQVMQKANKRGVRIMYHCVVGPRTLATTWTVDNPVRHPDDVAGLKIRIPSSEVLHQFYILLNAQIKRIEWGSTAKAARAGLIDGLDPAVLALYSGPDNIKDSLSAISLVDSVHDSWVCILNQAWLRALPKRLQDKMMEATELAFRDQLKEAANGMQTAEQAFADIGVSIHRPTDAEKEEWVRRAGHHLPAWDKWKNKLVGSLSAFDKLVEAAETESSYRFGG